MEVTRASPSRRERLRTATLSEIKGLARRLLVAGGPQAVSLRAIAREMGMTAPAIYRYYPSLDALVSGLTEDIYDEVRQTVEAARATHTGAAARLAAMARAFRLWSVGHPAEFGLVFGNPVPGVVEFEEGCGKPEHACARFGAAFLEVFAQTWPTSRLPTPAEEVIKERLGSQLEPYLASHDIDLPLPAAYAYLSAWIRLYGVVAMEVFGHLQWAVADVEPLFELELATFLAQLAPQPASG